MDRDGTVGNGARRTLSGNQVAIFLVALDAFFRQGLKSLLERPPGFAVVGEAETTVDALRLVRECQPQVIVSAISLPEIDPSDLASKLSEAGMNVPVLVVTRKDDPLLMRAMVRSPIAGYLLSLETTTELMASAIQAVRGGLSVFTPGVKRMMSEMIPPVTPALQASMEKLTLREREILDLMLEGMESKEIAVRLSISLRSAQLHTVNLLGKLGARSKVEAVLLRLEYRGFSIPPASVEP